MLRVSCLRICIGALGRLIGWRRLDKKQEKK
jgi:hypothetical protein